MTDRELLIRKGKIECEWNAKRQLEKQFDRIVNKYNLINKDGSLNEEGLYQWQKDKSYPLLSSDEEIIPRDEWKLDEITGVTKEALYHPHYNIWWNYIYEHHKPKHNILIVFECSNAKPYFSAAPMRYYLNHFCDVADFASIDYGIQPWDYVNYYPSRWDEWDHFSETEEMRYLYSELTKQRILEWHQHYPKQKMIFICQSEHPQRPVDELWKDNTNNFRCWAHILTNKKFRKELKEAYPQTPPGVLKMRTLNTTFIHQKLAELLERLTKRKDLAERVSMPVHKVLKITKDSRPKYYPYSTR